MRLALDCLDVYTEADIDAVRAVLRFEKARQRFCGNSRQHPRQGLEDHNLLAELGEHGGGFKADIATADHDDLPGRFSSRLHGVGIGASSHALHPREVTARQRQHSGMAARRPDQAGIANGRPAGGRHAMSLGIDRDDPRSSQQGD